MRLSDKLFEFEHIINDYDYSPSFPIKYKDQFLQYESIQSLQSYYQPIKNFEKKNWRFFISP